MSILHVMVCSTRPGRIGLAIGEWFAKQARLHNGFNVRLVDLKEVNLPIFDEPNHPMRQQYEHDHTKRWSEIVAEGDAFVFVMPEYNHSFNAALKNAIDYLYREWKFKPTAIVCYGGASGGHRAAQAIKPILTALDMTPISSTIAISNVQQHIKDARFESNEAYNGAVVVLLDALLRMQTALAPLRA